MRRRLNVTLRSGTNSTTHQFKNSPNQKLKVPEVLEGPTQSLGISTSSMQRFSQEQTHQLNNSKIHQIKNLRCLRFSKAQLNPSAFRHFGKLYATQAQCNTALRIKLNPSAALRNKLTNSTIQKFTKSKT
jgi:hypothetical protein